MKNPRKSIMLVLAAFGIAAAILLGSFLYITRYKTSDVDTVRSENGKYEAVLQAVGEPGCPFGSAPGRLVLKGEGETISKTDIEIANDGGPVSEKNWRVIWGEDHVEIRLSGGEQYDELVTMYYDGSVESRQLTTYYGSDVDNVSGDTDRGTEDAETGTDGGLFPGEQEITDGYKAVYGFCSGRADDPEVYFGAKESSSRCILSEDEDTVEYLTYSGRSQNEKCGLYVRYLNKKNADGTWDNTDGTIVDIYAYVYESGVVVSSGKTQWEDAGSDAYREVTGEE